MEVVARRDEDRDIVYAMLHGGRGGLWKSLLGAMKIETPR